jgi:hypothetical protein
MLVNTMIPINESLNLSCDETGRLVQKLLDLKSQHNVGIKLSKLYEKALDLYVKCNSPSKHQFLFEKVKEVLVRVIKRTCMIIVLLKLKTLRLLQQSLRRVLRSLQLQMKTDIFQFIMPAVQMDLIFCTIACRRWYATRHWRKGK